MKKIIPYIKLMRPHHYIKNILVFLPIVFSKNIFSPILLKTTILGVIAFSLMSSIVYIINDIKDVEADRKHEKKKNRPIASGAVSIQNATILAIILFLITTIINVYIVITNNLRKLCRCIWNILCLFNYEHFIQCKTKTYSNFRYNNFSFRIFI